MRCEISHPDLPLLTLTFKSTIWEESKFTLTSEGNNTSKEGILSRLSSIYNTPVMRTGSNICLFESAERKAKDLISCPSSKKNKKLQIIRSLSYLESRSKTATIYWFGYNSLESYAFGQKHLDPRWFLIAILVAQQLDKLDGFNFTFFEDNGNAFTIGETCFFELPKGEEVKDLIF